jgi:hypothetical protein
VAGRRVLTVFLGNPWLIFRFSGDPDLMSTILITNAISSGVAVLTFLSLALRRNRRRRQRVQRVYVTVDGQQVTRDETL